MKARTIKAILAKKFNEWVATITDAGLQKKVRHDGMITGGAIASMLLDAKVNDYDVYFRTAATAQAVAQYYVDLHNAATKSDPPVTVNCSNGRISIFVSSSGVTGELRMDAMNPEDTGAAEAIASVEPKGEYKVLYLSSNAITLSDEVQIIVRFTGEPEEIHKNYDFVHCTNYWTSRDEKLVLHAAAMEALLAKELRYVGSKYPLCSIIRTRKFIQRGWSINAGQYLKMALQLNELDLFDVEVLEDQLIGVDSAHFIALIEQVRSRNAEKLNAEYICEMIDRIF